MESQETEFEICKQQGGSREKGDKKKMTREAFEIELNKLDLLHKKYTEAYETLLKHVRSGKLDFLKEDDKTYKEAEAAWHTQLKKVYPDQQEYEDCDQI